MKSKEALTKLSNMASPYYWRTKEQIELISILEQELEILQIFKDNVMLDEDEKVITLFSKNKEVVKKVKEWLYRE